MTDKKEIKKKVDVQALETFEELTSHPLRMQIYFFLSSFGELSLTNLSTALKRSKTTVHHHTRTLEKKGILIAREEKKKHWIEKYYQMNPEIEHFILLEEKQDQKQAIAEGRILKKHVQNAIRSIGMAVYSMLNQFVDYLEEQPIERLAAQKLGTAISLSIKGRKEAEDFLEMLDTYINKWKKAKEDKKTPIEDLLAIFTVVLPYGEMFKEILEKKEQKVN
ncbi:MAG: winged helix-turn-helix domain-containing protein [Candidatus Hermodarchaeota archaeon]